MTHAVTIVMGVTGAGKSSWAAAEATATGARFIEGDDFHSRAARDRMTRGMALDDADRLPWLDRIARACIRERAHRPVVASCSALRLCYRNRLRAAIPAPLAFVFLDVPRAELERRLDARQGHFASPALLDSQLAALEAPLGEPDVRRIAIWRT